jgi:hypothetical protein
MAKETIGDKSYGYAKVLGEDRTPTLRQLTMAYGDFNAPKLWCWAEHDIRRQREREEERQQEQQLAPAKAKRLSTKPSSQ